jgi:hypothetical protein
LLLDDLANGVIQASRQDRGIDSPIERFLEQLDQLGWAYKAANMSD